MIEISLDARELEHPRPLEIAMKALHSLKEKEYFYMLHRKNPIPLLDFASEYNFQHFSKEDKSGDWHIVISHAKDDDITRWLKESIDV